MKKVSIGILLISTWKYNKFIDPTISSIREKFFPNSDVKIYLHTDSGQNHDADIVIKIQHKPWPLITLERFQLFLQNKKTYDVDYLLYLDIDSKIINTVDESILHNFFVVEHSGWKGSRGTPDNNPYSTAYIAPNENIIYVCGGLYGGKKDNFIQAIGEMKKSLDKNNANGITALWHDESHLNRYVLDHKDSTTIIDHSYMYAPHSKFPSDNPKIIPYYDNEKGFDKFENMVHK